MSGEAAAFADEDEATLIDDDDAGTGPIIRWGSVSCGTGQGSVLDR